MTTPQIDPALAALIAASGVILFFSAALHKFRDLRRFAETLAAYELLPRAAQPLLTILVAALEGAVAIALAVAAVRSAAAVAGSVLLCAYAAAIAINLYRGRRDLACGCGGAQDRRPIAGWMVGRNLLLAALLLIVTLPSGNRPLEATDVVTIGFGAATCALVYLCLDRLLATGRLLLNRH